MSENASSHSAVAHWRYQRLTAVALIPLTLWLLILFSKVLHTPYADTVAWLASPLNTLAIILWLGTVFYHAALGVQVVLEDYVAAAPRKTAIIASNVFFIVLGLAAFAAIVSIFFTR